MSAVAAVGRLIHAAGLVEAFGHVSSRAEAQITTTAPLGRAEAIALDGEPDARRPLEAPLHRAIYAARPDVGAIVRTHSPAAVAWGVRAGLPPLVHGLGALAGALARHDDPRLVTDDEHAVRAAGALGASSCLLLRANGALAVGADLAQAVVRAWSLEERCRVALAAGDSARALTGDELSDRRVHTPAEERRAWAWLEDRFG